MISEVERVALRADAEEATMHDMCRVFIVSASTTVTRGPYGQPQHDATEGDPGYDVPCGFRWLTTKELNALNEFEQGDAVLRLPNSVVVNTNAKVKLTERFGEKLEPPLEFNVNGEPQRGLLCTKVMLRRR